jgi:hypothetical protein
MPRTYEGPPFVPRTHRDSFPKPAEGDTLMDSDVELTLHEAEPVEELLESTWDCTVPLETVRLPTLLGIVHLVMSYSPCVYMCVLYMYDIITCMYTCVNVRSGAYCAGTVDTVCCACYNMLTLLALSPRI